MISLKFQDILFEPDKAFLNERMPGFKEDYLTLYSLIRRLGVSTVFEIGTNTGYGINVIASAVLYAKIYSLDLDFETMKDKSKQYPLGENGEDLIGSDAKFPYIQLRGDSMNFDYSKYPCEAYYVDGEHTKQNVYHETSEILKLRPKIIIFHDTDMQEVLDAIIAAHYDSKFGEDYILHRVTDTRISYLLNSFK